MFSKDVLSFEALSPRRGDHHEFTEAVIQRNAIPSASFDIIWTAMNNIDPTILDEVDQQLMTEFESGQAAPYAAGSAALEAALTPATSSQTVSEANSAYQVEPTLLNADQQDSEAYLVNLEANGERA